MIESTRLAKHKRAEADDERFGPTGQPPGHMIKLMGTQFVAVSEATCVSYIAEELAARRGGWVVTANLDHLRRLVVDPSYKQLCDGASLIVADGMPIVWAARMQGTALPERVAGSDLISSLSQAVGRQGGSVYLLGGEPGTAERAGEILAQRYPGLQIAGTDCPPMGFEREPGKKQAVVDRVVAARPDVVYVALGSPKQEQLIDELRPLLPGTWWMGVGISFSFLTGDVQRAPRWMRRIGLEWIHRLAQEPRRLARRYLLEDMPFAVRLFGHVLVRRFKGKTTGESSDNPAA